MGNLSTEAVFGLPKLVIIGLILLIVFVGIFTSPLAFGLALAVLVMLFFFLTLIQSTFNGIYVAAVYRYAAECEAGAFFRQEVVEGAFRAK